MNLCKNPACTWHIMKREHNNDNAGVQIRESNNNTALFTFWRTYGKLIHLSLVKLMLSMVTLMSPLSRNKQLDNFFN